MKRFYLFTKVAAVLRLANRYVGTGLGYIDGQEKMLSGKFVLVNQLNVLVGDCMHIPRNTRHKLKNMR